MGDFLTFRRMLLPLLIQIIFWLGVLAFIGAGLAVLFDKAEGVNLSQYADREPMKTLNVSGDTLKAVVGLTLCLAGPIVWRLICEVMIVLFRINGTLTDMRNAMLALQEVAERDRPAAPHPLPP